jgi:hypothetical protein
MKVCRILVAVALLYPAASFAQTVTTIGASSVKAADDFATRAFQDPWDMNQRTDVGPMLGSADQPASGFSNISFASGMFTGTTTASNANVWFLDTGNPLAAPVGKIGTNHPIDASTYKILALRMNVQNPAQIFVHAWPNTIYAPGQVTIASPSTSAGFRVYLLDLASLSSGAWSGPRRALRLDPAEGRVGEVVQIDWARLVNVDSSLCRTITWSGGGGSVNIYLLDANGNANLGPIALNASAGGASAGCLGSGSGYTFYAGALPAGTYRVGVVTAGSPAASMNVSAGTWVVNDAPTLTFTSPSEEGSDDDFATTQLGNAWDMDALSDVDVFGNVNSPTITTLNLEAPDGTPLGGQRVLFGTSAPVAPCPTGNGDPVVALLENNTRGKNTLIDADRYRLLTVEFGMPDHARDVNCGSIARIVWRQKGDLSPGTVSDDIIFNSRAGANVLDKFTVDLKTLLIDQGTGQGGTNWVNGPGGGIEIFRFDPHEFSPATPFFIKRIRLTSYEQAKTTYTIRWNYSKAFGSVDLYYTTVPNDFNSGTLIWSGLDATAGQAGFTWSIPPGLAESPAKPYYIYAKFTDGVNSNEVYAKLPIMLDSNYAPRPRAVLSRSALNFGITAGTTTTGPQTFRLSFVGAAPPCWTINNSNGNFAVSPLTGTGNQTITVSLVPQVFPGGGAGQAVLTVNECTPNTILNPGQRLTATYRIASSGAPPVGTVDTPADGATVTGSVGITGWVVDDIGIATVRIYRNPIPGEPADALGRVFLGDASRVDDARPDLAAAYPATPFNYRAGWGYLLLSNFLPGGGDGTYVIKVYATDLDGHETLLGTRTITGANSVSSVPFGAIDTPGQGATVSGVVDNFGWVLVRGNASASPFSGGAVSVVIDGVVVGSPTGWTNRGDLDAVFPAAIYSDISHALGVFSFDSNAYANGVHTISWVVYANNGQAAGIGSRYFTVANPSASVVLDPGDG